MEPGALIAGVELVEQQKESGQPLVDILRREIHAVVVIPKRAQRFIDVAVGLMVRGEPCQHIRVVLIIEMAYLKEVAGEAIAFRWSMAVVQVSRNRRQSKAAVIDRKAVDIADEDWHTVVADIGGTGTIASKPNMVWTGKSRLT